MNLKQLIKYIGFATAFLTAACNSNKAPETAAAPPPVKDRALANGQRTGDSRTAASCSAFYYSEIVETSAQGRSRYTFLLGNEFQQSGSRAGPYGKRI